MCFHIPDGWTDRLTDGEINPVWAGYPIGSSRLIGSSRYTRCTWAGGTFLRCLKKVPPAHPRSACVVQELGW
jgi:hypothetical protein